MTSRENMQAKVRAILERANHPNTPQAEAETALAFAFRLMQKYGLDGHKTPSRPAQPLSPIISRTFTIAEHDASAMKAKLATTKRPRLVCNIVTP